jgi:hypothetical protein
MFTAFNSNSYVSHLMSSSLVARSSSSQLQGHTSNRNKQVKKVFGRKRGNETNSTNKKFNHPSKEKLITFGSFRHFGGSR